LLWKQAPREPLLGASRPGIDLVIMFLLPPGIIGWVALKSSASTMIGW
jgi:hypothetical protein